MTMKTSLIITGDSAVAQKEVDALKTSLDRLGGAAKGAVTPANDLGRAQADVARGALNVSASATGAATASRTLSVAQGAVAQSSEGAARQMSGAVTVSGRMTASFGQLGTQANMLAGQVRNVEVGFGGLGGAIVQAEVKQSLFKQGAVMLGGVLAGALGGAITGLVAGLVDAGVQYLTVTANQEAAAKSSADLAAYVSDLGNYFDRTTGKIKETNAALVQYAVLSAQRRREDALSAQQAAAADAQGALDASLKRTFGSRLTGTVTDWLARGGMGGVVRNAGANTDVLDAIRAGRNGGNTDALLRQIADSGSSNAKLAERVLQGRAAFVKAARDVAAVDAEIESFLSGKIAGPASASAGSRKGGGAGNGRSGSSAAAAIRDTADASRETAATLAELAKDLQGVVSRYDPARKAAADYADELDRINRLAAAYDPEKGLGISADQATSYMVGAMGAYSAAQTKNAEDRFSRIFGAGAVKDAEDEMWGMLLAYRDSTEAVDDFADATRDAAAAQADLRNMAMGALDAIIVGGDKASDVVKRLGGAIASAALEATLFGTGPFAALLGGAGSAGRSGAAGTASPIAASTANKAAADTIADAIGKRMEGVFGAGGGFAVTLRNAGLGYAAGGATGSPLGGAIGGMVGGKAAEKFLSGVLGSWAGPLGSIAGGLIGGLVGGIFAPKAKPGGATVSAVNGQAAMSGSVGSDRAGIQAGSGMAGSVAQTINQIASQLGGGVGNFSVQIGTYKDAIRVNVDGRPLGGVKGSGAVGFGSDENAAVNYAAAQAIAQGAITGVSDAVAKALRSSSDVEASLKEALKVQQIEVLMGGVGGQIEKAFKDFEATAKERVRIAQQYGFDVVAIEKRNAEDRAKLAQELLQGQVGSLKRLIEEMTHGSLFEGSALDRISALKTEIDTAKADLDAGIDGAGDTLAGLYEQLNAASKAAYGSTSGYAADRSMILDDARAAIARANQQIADAQARSDPALAATNAALDENNDQNAEMLAELREQNELLRQMVAAGGGYAGYDLYEAARV